MNFSLEIYLPYKYKNLRYSAGILILIGSLLKEAKAMNMILGKCKLQTLLPNFQ